MMAAVPAASLQFLKLGGSLITDKTRPQTPRPDRLRSLVQEIAAARRNDPDLRLLLGHGSGSFGHVPARRYGTRQGVHTAGEWLGFVEVGRAAAALNRIVLEALWAAGLPALPFSPLASVTAEDGQATAWDLSPLRAALDAGLLPVVYGDVIFDRRRGGTILSTEDLFEYLAPRLCPRRVLLAGLEAGVWADFPTCTQLIPEITQENVDDLRAALGGSAAVDVTGGMAAKVQGSLRLARSVPGLHVRIFSGEQPGAVSAALRGESTGTLIR
jgi:isopentenyl phosphate kinase